jgi:phage FluMu protein Com
VAISRRIASSGVAPATAVYDTDDTDWEELRRNGITDTRPRCYRCRRVLAELVTRPWHIKCERCGEGNLRPVPVNDVPEGIRMALLS